MVQATRRAEEVLKAILERGLEWEFNPSQDAQRLEVPSSRLFNARTKAGLHGRIAESPDQWFATIFETQDKAVRFGKLAEVLGPETTLGELAALERNYRLQKIL